MNIDDNEQIYEPHIQLEKCNVCGICYSACPGHSVDFKTLNTTIFGKEPEDIILGNYLDCNVGHATDPDIRYQSASGGIVTGLLVYALEHGIIDGALVTRMSKDHPLEPEPFIARTRDEIIEASRSKYCPVPTNTVIREILRSSEGERFAVVGLPCHIHGIRKAESLNEKLKDKIVLHIGLFCSHNDTFWQTDYILKKLHVSKDSVRIIRYRGQGWPGSFAIELMDGKKKSLPYHRQSSPMSCGSTR